MVVDVPDPVNVPEPVVVSDIVPLIVELGLDPTEAVLEAVCSEVGVRLVVLVIVRVTVRLRVLDIDPVTEGVPVCDDVIAPVWVVVADEEDV